MDEYSKTGPKNPRSLALDRARIQTARLRRVLDAASEEIFISELKATFQVTDGHPRFQEMLKLYRAQHPSA